MAARILIPLLALFSLTPWVSSAQALITGVAVAIIFGNPYIEKTRKITSSLLGLSVAGMGAGMDLAVVGKVGLQGVGYTVAGISLTLLLGTLLGKLFKVEKDTSILVTVGTAICGGSAIAAVAPVIRAKNEEVSVALGTVFLLNAMALFIFPPSGHFFELSQNQFGLWSALAIHDTSSVVGASMQYGAEALQVGTTVKLARALWIIPVAFLIGTLYKKNSDGQKVKAKRPWFILWFIMAAALVTFVPSLQPAGHVVSDVAKRFLVLTLFLIGLSLSKETLKKVGIKPFLQGVGLWIIVSSATLAALHWGWIH